MGLCNFNDFSVLFCKMVMVTDWSGKGHIQYITHMYVHMGTHTGTSNAKLQIQILLVRLHNKGVWPFSLLVHKDNKWSLSAGMT